MALNHLFNPENDLALAYGGQHYTAPPLARQLHDDGAPLPIWYGEEGDGFVWKNPDLDWLEEVSQRYGLQMSPCITAGDARPWGWSLDARRQLIDAGVVRLPDDDYINRLRELSHRRISIKVMARLRDLLSCELPEVPFEAFSADEVVRYAIEHPGCYIKAPWSSSGRGVVCADMLSESELRRRVSGTIRRQGSILCEEGLDKVADFAMLFNSDGSKAKRVGLSCFFNERGAAYAGNIIAPQSEMAQLIGTSEEALADICCVLEQTLTEFVASHYIGYFGVDMMLYRGKTGIAIAPCVEVNLRMTMGVVAMKLGERFLAEGSRGVMRVSYGVEHRATDAVVESGRIVRGVQNLVPESPRGFSITMEATCD